MSLLLALYLGHLLGDFAFQPGWLVSAKRGHAWGLLLHVGVIGASTALILGPQLVDLWNIVLLAMAAHTVIELVTIRLRDVEHLSGLSTFLIDQGLHITSLVALVWVGSGFEDVEATFVLGFEIGTPLLALACSLIAVTFMGSIIAHEVVNAFGPERSRRTILPWSLSRVLGMIERAAALLVGVIVSPALIFVPFVPRAIVALRASEDARVVHMLVAVTGFAVCVTGWFAVALVTLAAAGAR